MYHNSSARRFRRKNFPGSPSVTGFLSIGRDDVEKSGTIKPAFLIRTLVEAYKTLAKEEPAMRTHAAREIALLRNPKTMAEALRTLQRVECHQQRNVLSCRQRSIRGKNTTNRSKTDPHQASP